MCDAFQASNARHTSRNTFSPRVKYVVAQGVEYSANGRQSLTVRRPDMLQNLVRVTVQNIEIGTPMDARFEAIDKSLFAPIKRFALNAAKKNITKPVENQTTCPTSTVDKNQRAGQKEGLSDPALAAAQSCSEHEKITASIK